MDSDRLYNRIKLYFSDSTQRKIWEKGIAFLTESHYLFGYGQTLKVLQVINLPIQFELYSAAKAFCKKGLAVDVD